MRVDPLDDRALGLPVSTTQTISGSVVGAGSIRGLSAVRWSVAGNILIAWVLTLPTAGLVGAVMEVITRLPLGDAHRLLVRRRVATGAFLARRWETRRLLPAVARRSSRLAAFELASLPAGEDLREDVHHQHERDQHERRRPARSLLAGVGRLGEGEDRNGQRRQRVR